MKSPGIKAEANNIHDKPFKNEEDEEEEIQDSNRYTTTSPSLPELISNEDELDSTRCLNHERLKPIARRASFDITDNTNNSRYYPYTSHSHSRSTPSSTPLHSAVTVKEEDNSRHFGYSRRMQRNTSPPEYYLSNYSMIEQRIPITSISPPLSTPTSTKYQGRDRMSSSSTIQSEYHRSVSFSPSRDQKPALLSPRHTTPFMPYRRLSSRPDLSNPTRTTVSSHQEY